MIIYNDNITLLEIATQAKPLEKNEYYVLMVTDEFNRAQRKKSDYWDFQNGYLGLERTDNRIYISKKFHLRKNISRGITFLCAVKDLSKCCLLEL